MTFLSGRFHRLLWQGLRGSARALPDRSRGAALSLGSAAMLPATLLAWLGLETSAFALMYLPCLAAGWFRLSGNLAPQLGTACYFSAGDITSLTFGDVVPRARFSQALTVLETVTGPPSGWRWPMCSPRSTRWAA